MGPLEAFELQLRAELGALRAQIARVENNFAMNLRKAYEEQQRIDAMHARSLHRD